MKKRISSLLVCLCMLAAVIPFSASAAGTLVWPVPGHHELSQYYHSDHQAIDISDGSIAGAEIRAAMGGTVNKIYLCPDQHYGSNHDCNGFGTGLAIYGDDGRTYEYCHMMPNSIPSNVYFGARVEQGQVIGKVGTTGNSSGYHLHFGIANGSNYWENKVDPMLENYYPDGSSTISKPKVKVVVVESNEINVQVMWDDVGAASYYSYFHNEDTGSDFGGADLGKSFSRYYHLDPGNYKAYITAVYNSSTMASSAQSFSVGQVDLDVEVVPHSSDKSKVLVRWNDVGAVSYYSYIHNTDTNTDSQGQNVGKNFTRSFELTPGKYKAFVTACFSETEMYASFRPFRIGENTEPQTHTHSLTKTTAKEPTCTADGNMDYWTCSDCGKVFSDAEGTSETTVGAMTLQALGHDYQDGVCTRCGEADPDHTPPAAEPDPENIPVPTIEPQPVDIVGPDGIMNPFVDVAKDAYYFDAVLWAYYAEPQITDGIADDLFGPAQTVTRGQAVTFLWRAMGCPKPDSKVNPFVDVKGGDYYYNAVLWATQAGVTLGTSDTTFSPSATLSTRHIVTFLYGTLNPGQDG